MSELDKAGSTLSCHSDEVTRRAKAIARDSFDRGQASVYKALRDQLEGANGVGPHMLEDPLSCVKHLLERHAGVERSLNLSERARLDDNRSAIGCELCDSPRYICWDCGHDHSFQYCEGHSRATCSCHTKIDEDDTEAHALTP